MCVSYSPVGLTRARYICNIFTVIHATEEGVVSLSEQAYQRIKKKIVSLELPPGSVLDEAELREELELGRTPIREALIRLSQEQLVTIVPRRGTFVTNIGLSDLQQLSEVRLQLEALAARLAARRGDTGHWEKMTAALASLPAATNNEALIAIDEACHEIIYDATGNRFLRETLTTLYALSLRLWYFSLAQMGDVPTAIRDHRAILKALRDRDGERAEQLMEAHVRHFHECIQQSMLGAEAVDG